MKMKIKFDKYWENVENLNTLLLIAVVLDPRSKLKYVKFCYFEISESAIVHKITKKVKDTLNKLYAEYQKLSLATCTLSSSKTSSEMEVDQPSVSGEVSSLKSTFQKHLEEKKVIGESRKLTSI